jgi:hypothetical protein
MGVGTIVDGCNGLAAIVVANHSGESHDSATAVVTHQADDLGDVQRLVTDLGVHSPSCKWWKDLNLGSRGHDLFTADSRSVDEQGAHSQQSSQARVQVTKVVE